MHDTPHTRLQLRDVLQASWLASLLNGPAAAGLHYCWRMYRYQYHPPFTFGWQRVNEVLYEVKAAARQ